MSRLAKQIIAGTFSAAFLLIVLEHAGGFSSILTSGSKAYATGYKALTGH